MNIEGHVALVTGANKGLGREVARQLARKGLAGGDSAVAPCPTKRAELGTDDLPVFHALKFSVCFTERNSAFDRLG
jgi:NAD(P)-dependent dehydrogenase (short-subunit alcohol dehydrogenase family)